MKKNLLIFIVFSIAYFAVGIMQAQTLKTYSGEKEVFFEGGRLNCKETYTYYVGEDGGFVKSGNYSLKGSAKIYENTTATYIVTATYKKGILYGPLTAKLTVKGRGNWNSIFHQYDQYNIERTLSANFKGGLPDAKWTYSETGLLSDDKSVYKTTFTCKDGELVGDFNCNFSDIILPKHQQGTFDQDGHLLSLTIQGDGAGNTMGGYWGDKDATVEYHLNGNNDLLTYFHRDKNNRSIKNYRVDENLLKEYEEQNKSLKLFMEEKGYYLKKETSLEKISYNSYDFSTKAIVEYILRQLCLNKYLDGFEGSDGLFYNYYVNKCDFSKVAVKPLSVDVLRIWEDELTNELEENYDSYSDKTDTSVVSQISKNYVGSFEAQSDMFFISSISNGICFFDSSIYLQVQHDLFKVWNNVKEKVRNEEIRKIEEKKNTIRNTAKEEVAKYLNEVKSWPEDGYKEKTETIGDPSSYAHYTKSLGKKIVKYYEQNTDKAKIWQIIYPNVYVSTSSMITKAMEKFEKFHKVMSYNIDTVYLSENFDTATLEISIYKSNLSGYQTYKSEAFCRIDERNGRNICQLIWNKSFQKAERVNNICDTSEALGSEILNNILKKYSIDTTSTQQLKKSFNEVLKDKTYQIYQSEVDKPDPSEENLILWNNYFAKKIRIQEDYIRFLELSRMCEANSETITSNKDKNITDIVESYQNISKDWSMNVEKKGAIKEEIKRVEDYVLFQRHCLLFIKLRKTISENNIKINTNSGKDYADVDKSYTTFFRGYNISFSSDTTDNNSRLNKFISVQDSCFSFIELRKTIAQNNNKIAGYSKSASNIVKTYNTYLKSTDFLWNQEAGRNQELREIINGQNELLNVLSKPNISEINATVKKSKAKTWEEVKKIIIQ